MFMATITSKGQTTIPIEIRELLHLKPGDKIAFDIVEGRVTLRAKNLPITALKGMLHHHAQKPLSQKDMDKAIGDYLGNKYAPKRRKKP